MGAIGDILRVSAIFTVYGQECRNVFFYRIEAPSDGSLLATTLAQAYFDNQLPFWQGFAANNAQFDSVIVDNLTDGLDFGEYENSSGGGVGTIALPAIWAVNVTLPRTSKLTRNGSKRISGLNEELIENGVWTLTAPVITAIQNWCSGTVTLVDYDGGGSDAYLNGVIVGRTPNTEGVYELDLSKINPYGTPIVNTVATTQRTRKA